MQKLTPFLYLILAAVVAIMAVASLVSMVLALTVRHTLSAVESALGTGVLTIILAVIAVKLFNAGRGRLRDRAQDNT